MSETTHNALPSSGKSGLMSRLGLARPELRAWAMYDWAVSAVQTTIMVAVFPVYFVNIAKIDLPESRATQAIATANTIVAVVLAILSPVLGAVSDYVAAKKRLLGASMLVGSGRCGGDVLRTARRLSPGAGTVRHFPHWCDGEHGVLRRVVAAHRLEDEIDRVSSAGYAVGYIGGGLLLALNLAWILKPEWFGLPSGPNLSGSETSLPTRLAFLSVAVWWVVFSIPLFRRVPEPPRTREPDEISGGNVLVVPFVRVAETFRRCAATSRRFSCCWRS